MKISPCKKEKTRNRGLIILLHLFFLLIIPTLYILEKTELQKQVNSERIMAVTTTLSKLFYDSGLSIGAYSLTKNHTFIDRYQKLIGQIPANIETLKNLLKKQPVKIITFNDINTDAQTALKQLDDAKNLLKDSGLSPLSDSESVIRHAYKEIKHSADQLQTKLDTLTQSEQNLAQENIYYLSLYELLLAATFFCYVGLNLFLYLRS